MALTCPATPTDSGVDKFVSNTLDAVDTAAAKFICTTNTNTDFNEYIQNLWWISAVIAISYIGYNLMFGGNMTVREMVGKLGQIVLILLLVRYFDNFSIIFYNVATVWPNEIGNLILGSTTGGSAADTATYGTGLNGALSEFFDAGMRTARRIKDGKGWFNGFWGNVFAVFTMIVVFFMTAAALMLLILSKLVVAVVLAVGPVFVIGLMFERTRGFFEGWYRALMSFAFIPVILYGLLAMIMTIIGGRYNIAASTSVAGFTNGITVVGPLIIICMVGTALITQVQGIAAQIAGGVALNTQAGIRWAANAAKAGGGAAAGWGARKTLRGGKRLGSGVVNHVKNNHQPSKKRLDKSGIKEAATSNPSSSPVTPSTSSPRSGTNPASTNSGAIGGNAS